LEYFGKEEEIKMVAEVINLILVERLRREIL
jgi:hypothetical protein